MKLRLPDAVVIAALGLLGLKGLDLFWPAGQAGDAAGAGASLAAPDRAGADGFGRALWRGRAGAALSTASADDPEVTGSVAAGKPAGQGQEDGKAADGKAAEGKAAAEAEARPAHAGAAASGGPAPGAGGPAPPQLIVSKPVSMEPGGNSASAAERALLERLGARRDELEGRSRELDTREKLLETAEKRIETRLGELKGIEDRLTEGDRKKKEAEAQALKNLVTMYESMKPREAARVFDRLPHDVLVPVVLQMNPRKMAEVLAAMAPESAQKLTVALASRARINGGDNRGAAGGLALPANELPAIDASVPPPGR